MASKMYDGFELWPQERGINVSLEHVLSTMFIFFNYFNFGLINPDLEIKIMDIKWYHP